MVMFWSITDRIGPPSVVARLSPVIPFHRQEGCFMVFEAEGRMIRFEAMTFEKPPTEPLPVLKADAWELRMQF